MLSSYPSVEKSKLEKQWVKPGLIPAPSQYHICVYSDSNKAYFC